MTTYLPSECSAEFRSYRWPLLKAAILVGALALPGVLLSQSSNASSHPAKSESEGRHIKANVHDGILTVDGMVAKVGLNYPVDAEYLYFFIPGVGTAIVSEEKFPNATPQRNAVSGETLTVTASGHEIQLTNGGPLFKDRNKDELWVALNPNYASASSMPMMGYGGTLAAPYQWPGSKNETRAATNVAPPVPVALRPKMETASSYTVTVPPSSADKDVK